MNKQELKSLLNKYQQGILSPEEHQCLQDFVGREGAQQLISEVWDHQFEALPLEEVVKDKEFMYQRIMADNRVQGQTSERRIIGVYGKLIVAASVLLALTVGGFWFFTNNSRSEDNSLQVKEGEIKPGSDKARIIFEDGTYVELDKLVKDTLITDKSLHIFKREDGTIASEFNGNTAQQGSIYNTVVTPKGGEYSLVLPDGSQVWINAASKLRYPMSFSDDVREVTLEGEAYFEVKKQQKNGKRVPFIVRTGDQKLEVLGTSFNINNYSKHITTTLVEGSVALSYPSSKGVQYLKPSQQANYSMFTKDVSVKQVDPYYTTAWRRGSFAFENASIYQVMDDIARWYDVDIVFKGDLSNVRYSGTISRFENFKQLLQIIEWTDLVTLKVEGRRVTVMK